MVAECYVVWLGCFLEEPHAAGVVLSFVNTVNDQCVLKILEQNH